MHINRFWKLRSSKKEWMGHIQWNVSFQRRALGSCKCIYVNDRLDYAGPEILRGERYSGKEQDVWAFGVVAYVMLVGECPFTTAAEAQDGLKSPFATASIALDERCADGKEREGEGEGREVELCGSPHAPRVAQLEHERAEPPQSLQILLLRLLRCESKDVLGI